MMYRMLKMSLFKLQSHFLVHPVEHRNFCIFFIWYGQIRDDRHWNNYLPRIESPNRDFVTMSKWIMNFLAKIANAKTGLAMKCPHMEHDNLPCVFYDYISPVAEDYGKLCMTTLHYLFQSEVRTIKIIFFIIFTRLHANNILAYS